MRSMSAGVWIAAAGLLGCGQSQAGSDYAGEPLMTLRGVVKGAAEALVMDELVPGLRLEASNTKQSFACKGEPDEVCSYYVHYVKGDVQGEFPSAFTLRLYEAPDPFVLEEHVDGEPAYVQAAIVAISPEHPKWIRTDTWSETNESETATYAIREACSDTDQCIKGNLAECPPEEGNYLDIYPCGNGFPEGYPWALRGYSPSHGLIYFAEEIKAGSLLSLMFARGKALTAGYHVTRTLDLATELSADELAANDECIALSAVEATEVVNHIYGTNYEASRERINANFDSYPDQSRTWKENHFRGVINRGCILDTQVVDVTKDPIELTFSDTPPFVAAW